MLKRDAFGQPLYTAKCRTVSRISVIERSPLFKAAFPNEPQPITLQNITKALSAYERTLLTPSPFDGYLAGNQEALSPDARAGYR